MMILYLKMAIYFAIRGIEEDSRQDAAITMLQCASESK